MQPLRRAREVELLSDHDKVAQSLGSEEEPSAHTEYYTQKE